MNRAQRRSYAKRINTPQKLESFSAELERQMRREISKEYEKIYTDATLDYFKKLGMLFAYSLDCELESEETIRVTARKCKNMSPKIAEAVKKLTDNVMKQLKYLEDGDFTMEDVEEYLREERGIEWKW